MSVYCGAFIDLLRDFEEVEWPSPWLIVTFLGDLDLLLDLSLSGQYSLAGSSSYDKALKSSVLA